MSALARASAGDPNTRYLGPVPGFDPLALHAAAPERYPFLLESSAGAPAQGRYDLLFAFPGESLSLSGGRLRGRHAPQTEGDDFFAALDAWAAASAPLDSPLPFAGGWFVYLGYELAAQVEPRLTLPADPLLPAALAVRCRGAIVRERANGALWLAAEAGDAALDELEADLRAGCAAPRFTAPRLAACREAPAADYLTQVAAIRDYVRAGDVFQVNLSREWRATLAEACDPASLYAALRAANPAPFSGLMRWKGAAVLSSSPERLLRIDKGVAETRPIAGTRARRGADAAVARELLAHPKERAEHVMLIDLERNDLGRVCAYGSIAVDELMALESYAHVHHIVSNVRGRLRPGVGPGAALRAVFPGGTITGAPKLRCMEIIRELEGAPRGAYTGSFGYLGVNGRLDTNILIRSLVQQGREVSLRAGAGIVADSVPEQELAETRAKARGLLLALGAAG